MLKTVVLLLFQTIAEGKSITGDLGGKASTKEYTDAIIQKLRAWNIAVDSAHWLHFSPANPSSSRVEK